MKERRERREGVGGLVNTHSRTLTLMDLPEREEKSETRSATARERRQGWSAWV